MTPQAPLRRNVFAFVVLAGCASGPQDTPPAPVAEPFQPARTEAPDPSPLDRYAIPPGRCGMILWTKSGGRVSPIFRSVDVTTASMNVEGEEVAFALQRQSGDLRLGMRSQQRFTATSDRHQGLTLDLQVAWGTGFPSGLYVDGGSITLNAADGWSRILPVAGIAGCKA